MASSRHHPSDHNAKIPTTALEIGFARPSPEIVDPKSLRESLRWGYAEAAGEIPHAERVHDPFEQIPARDVISRLRKVRLDVAEAADTIVLARSDAKYRYLKSELGFNMIVPTGKLTELRFHVDLRPASVVPDPDPPVALDGFPHSDVEQKALLAGQIRIAVDEALKFIPFPTGVSLPVGLELEPWTFRLGTGRRVNIQFSGGLTSEPEWYVTEQALLGEFRIAMIIRTPVTRKKIDATVQAYLRYDPGFWHRADAFTRKAYISILNEETAK
jgi:hypothetical protein